MSQTEIEVGARGADGVLADGHTVVQYKTTGGINDLIALAIEKDGAIDVIERLADLREKEMAREAEEQFMQAFAEFRSECPPIPRSKKGAAFVSKGGVTSYVFYAPLEKIQEIVDPILHRHGLSYWWSSEATPDTVVTTCHLRHVGGYERTSSMALPVTGPPKSSKTQAHAGTRTFNNRLTLSDVLGIQTTDDLDGEDGDGAAEVLTESQVLTIREWLTKADSTEISVLHFAQASTLEEITQDKYDTIIATLTTRATRRGTA